MTTWHYRELPIDFGGAAQGVMASHVVAAEGTQHVFFVGVDSHVIEIWWSDSHPPQAGDLNSTAEPPFQPGCLSSHVFPLDAGTQHVFHLSPERHIIEVRWTGGESAKPRDLTDRSGGPPRAPLAFSALTSFAVDGNGTQHVIYTAVDEPAVGQFGGQDGHIIELRWSGDEDPTARNLTELSGHPPFPAGILRSHVYPTDDNTSHVFYNASGHIWELWWRGDDVPTARDLTPVGSGAPLAVSAPASHVFAGDPVGPTQHVFYTGENGHVMELWWRNSTESPHLEDLTARCPTAPPVPLSPLTSHVLESEHTQHVYYLANGPSPSTGQTRTGRVIEIWWKDGGGPQAEDLTRRSPGAPLAIVPWLSPPVSHVVDAGNVRTQHVFFTATIGGGVNELRSEP